MDDPPRPPLELRALIDSVPAVVWFVLPDGSPEFINQRFFDYSGLPPNHCSAEWRSTFHPDDLEEFATWWEELLQSRQPVPRELRLRRADGEYRWFHMSAAPAHDGQGGLIGWYGVGVDIEDRKRAEQERRRIEEELRTITDAIRQFIVVVAPDGTTLYANRVALETTGFTLGDLTDPQLLARAGVARPAQSPGELAWNQVWWLALHPDDRDRWLAERRKRFPQGSPFEVELRCRFKTGGHPPSPSPTFQYRWQLFQYNPLKEQVLVMADR